MRGKAKIPSRWEGVNGITPAYAGKRSQAISTGKRNRGSPPPMRGKGRVVDVMKNGERITPAYAGKSAPDGCWWMLRKDHPRLCGEKPNPDSPGTQAYRITPAYAGKSGLKGKPLLAREDHPRLCGEKFRHARWNASGRGSPPPMRGKAFSINCRKLDTRITPAYAGKRILYQWSWLFGQDHPRLCGEKGILLDKRAGIQGSPPPMRGKAAE